MIKKAIKDVAQDVYFVVDRDDSGQQLQCVKKYIYTAEKEQYNFVQSNYGYIVFVYKYGRSWRTICYNASNLPANTKLPYKLDIPDTSIYLDGDCIKYVKTVSMTNESYKKYFRLDPGQYGSIYDIHGITRIERKEAEDLTHAKNTEKPCSYAVTSAFVRPVLENFSPDTTKTPTKPQQKPQQKPNQRTRKPKSRRQRKPSQRP